MRLASSLLLNAESPQPKGRGLQRPEAADARRASGAESRRHVKIPRRKKLIALAGLASLGWLASLAAEPASAAPPALGGGAVYSMHVDLFRAVDAGDAAAVRKLLGERERGLLVDAEGELRESRRAIRMFLLDERGEPATADALPAALDLLVATDGAGAWKTRILEGYTDCPSPDVSFAVLVFERTRTIGDAVETRRYRSTSLVSHVDGGWKLWHMHVSPAE